MKIPLKIRLLLWLINRDATLQIHQMSAPQARQVTEKKKARIEKFLDYAPLPLHRVFDLAIPGRDSQIPVRIYQPTAEKNLPLIVYFHGGGFVLPGVDSHDKVCRRIAHDNQAVVLSVEYRLAPEFKFPIPVHDSYDATVWAAENAALHHGDPTRLVVMGDSAGGNLATAVCLLARDLQGPKIACQVLIYPCTDATMGSDSITTYGAGYLLTHASMKWFVGHYKATDKDLYSPYMSMLLADDVTNLPPAFVFTAEYDPLKDEGRQYAEKLRAAGNEVLYKDYGGLIHGFMNMPKMSPHILGAYADIRAVLAKYLSPNN
ncbi:MAG: alpha/beta hydrolase [Bacteroidetes bacterium]|nr:MAG: alpha/beta hydrolase [Bacteroidota bacterium]PTM10010.1 MAG: alpha/beta hydrolase [Bacteroidota bacterium]